jgi:acetyl/propionyl-CoA carboxylase alpha subunit
VEVQLLGDGAGTVVALGERDCSIQRRHQKLVEEAPAPGLDPGARAALHAHAVALGLSAGLRSAATAEFLLDADGRPWFLEVNARLQVEHGVTELVSGVDLVHEQLRIAAGEPLSDIALQAAQRAADPSGHAIEGRLTAEDPAEGFRPTPGRIARWREPAGPGIRVDGGVEEGSTVPPEYDSLLAKVMAWGVDRRTALDRFRQALRELDVGGLQTNLPFLLHVATDPAFAAGPVDTGYVGRAWPPGPLRRKAARAAGLAAALVTGSTAQPWAATTKRPPAQPPGRWRQEALREAVERWP